MPTPVAQLRTMLNDVVLGRTESGGLRVFFSGLTGVPGQVDGYMRTAVGGADGTGWSPPQPASNATPTGVSPVYVASGIDAAPAADGTPWTIWGDSGPGEAGFHVGLDSLGA